jgi:hypothetical protein
MAKILSLDVIILILENVKDLNAIDLHKKNTLNLNKEVLNVFDPRGYCCIRTTNLVISPICCFECGNYRFSGSDPTWFEGYTVESPIIDIRNMRCLCYLNNDDYDDSNTELETLFLNYIQFWETEISHPDTVFDLVFDSPHQKKYKRICNFYYEYEYEDEHYRPDQKYFYYYEMYIKRVYSSVLEELTTIF